jgi:hypothetical protein
LTRPAALITVLLLVQVTLGALTVLTRREVWINSVHLVCGALVLATSIVITLRSWRVRFSVAVPRFVRGTSDAESIRLGPGSRSVRDAGLSSELKSERGARA